MVPNRRERRKTLWNCALPTADFRHVFDGVDDLTKTGGAPASHPRWWRKKRLDQFPFPVRQIGFKELANSAKGLFLKIAPWRLILLASCSRPTLFVARPNVVRQESGFQDRGFCRQRHRYTWRNTRNQQEGSAMAPSDNGTRKKAAIIGGGVIGAGWAARFLLNGWDVSVHDPDTETERKMCEVLENARRALPGLSDVSLPEEGRIEFVSSIEAAVEGAEWIQESVPERLDLKVDVLRRLSTCVSETTIIGSSTSGFKPSILAEGQECARQIIVCHPFNPVYLLPLVEVVAHADSDPAMVRRAEVILAGLGMKPLIVRKEIDAHIADRLLEAVWREALWLVKDGVATTAEIDDAIRLGFGLRWAQMGLFETYRIAGGEAGMEHFIAQFGPCLQSPWSRLTDVPELTTKLVKLVAAQSDEQAEGLGIRQLERIRDKNLVAILRALKSENWAAGKVLNAHDSLLKPTDPHNHDRPIRTLSRTVPLNWTDYNGHMNEARYLQAFSEATDRFMEIIGCDMEYVASGKSYFTVETHIRHLDEVHAGKSIRIDTTCLLGESRKMRLFHEMLTGDGRTVATGEHMLLHVDLNSRRTSPAEQSVEKRLRKIAARHARLGPPEGSGRAIG